MKKKFLILILITTIILGFTNIMIMFLDRNFNVIKTQTIENTTIQSNSMKSSWIPNGILICSENSGPLYMDLCSDGAGGVIAAWADDRGTGLDIYAQIIDSDGYLQGVPDGIVICSAIFDQGPIKICSDLAGGAIIGWKDKRVVGANDDIYASRLISSVLTPWTSDGEIISNAANLQTNHDLISDGTKGAFIVWADTRGADKDIYAQQVDRFGITLWMDNGTWICKESDTQDFPVICSDGAGGAIIAWQDNRSGSNFDIYAQRINSSGAKLWGTPGVIISNASDNQVSHSIISDGTGGAIITWEDSRDSGSTGVDIYAQRINSSGVIQWINNGTPICTLAQDQELRPIVSDGAGGAIIAWRRGETGNGIYMQHIDSNGMIKWTPNGTRITNLDVDPLIRLCSDGAGGAYVAWADLRGIDYDIYVQWISSDGAQRWSTDGEILCNVSDNQYPTAMINDGEGGVIITWTDGRGGGGNYAYAQRIKNMPAPDLPQLLLMLAAANQPSGLIDMLLEPTMLIIIAEGLVILILIIALVKKE
jgi:hypothetical protein